jgi:hypothetical protein
MGGQVSLSGAAAYSERAVTGKLSPMSSNSDLAVNKCRFTPDLELEVKAAGEVSAPASVDILDTHPHLNQARLASAQKGESKPRGLSLTVDRGVLGGTPPARAIRVSAFLCGDLPDHHLDCPQSARTCR